MEVNELCRGPQADAGLLLGPPNESIVKSLGVRVTCFATTPQCATMRLFSKANETGVYERCGGYFI
jgi:hypothetical protein